MAPPLLLVLTLALFALPRRGGLGNRVTAIKKDERVVLFPTPSKRLTVDTDCSADYADAAARKGRAACVAGVALPLADERGRLVSGEVRARLWPHPELQLKRDPKLASAKSDDNVRQLNLSTGALGPAPSFAETDRRATQCGFGGELLVRFDAHPLPVLEQTVRRSLLVGV